jgi:voltage-gated potassium channel
MTDQPNQELPPAPPRRLIIGALLRGLVVTTVLVVLYYELPLDRPLDTGIAARLLIGLLVFAGLTVWQVKAITSARYPGLRTAKALGLIIPLYLLLFASTYFLMERASAANFTQPLSRTDALYFSVTVFTTVGFGDITARSETARVVLIVQQVNTCPCPRTGRLEPPSAGSPARGAGHPARTSPARCGPGADGGPTVRQRRRPTPGRSARHLPDPPWARTAIEDLPQGVRQGPPACWPER